LNSAAFFSIHTFNQMILYALVGLYEWVGGYEILNHLPISGFFAFGIQSAVVGFTCFHHAKVYRLQTKRKEELMTALVWGSG